MHNSKLVRLLLLLLLSATRTSYGSSHSEDKGNDEAGSSTSKKGEEPTCSLEDNPEGCADPNNDNTNTNNNNNNNNNNKSGNNVANPRPGEQAQNFHAYLADMFDEIDAYANSASNPDRRVQEQLILTSWLTWFDMDPALVTATTTTTEPHITGNWMYELYVRTRKLAPALFFKVWDERARPSKEEIRILLYMDDSAYQAALTTTDKEGGDGQERLDQSVLMNHLFLPFRHRGFTATLLDTFCRVLLGPLKTIAYAIPSPSNLEILHQYAPLIEVGAGSGYWSAALQQQYGREDIITPYDAHPPVPNNDDKDSLASLYFDRTYTKVHQGDCQSLFGDGGEQDKQTSNNNNHTLLLVWPNNPDNIDNAAEFHSPRLPPVWDAACVRSFLEASADNIHVILVAERESNIHILPDRPDQGSPTMPDSGLCATRELQTLLHDEFDLLHQMSVPTWYYNDDLTVWRRKAADGDIASTASTTTNTTTTADDAAQA